MEIPPSMIFPWYKARLFDYFKKKLFGEPDKTDLTYNK